MTTLEGLVSAGGLYVIVTLELVTDMNIGGATAAQHNKLCLKNTLGYAK